MFDIRMLIYFLIVLVVVVGLTVFILDNMKVSQPVRNIVLAVEGLAFLLWFLQIANVL